MQMCRRCKATWPDSLVDEWGQHSESAGYGPEARCVAIVKSRDPRHPDAQERCGGQLAYWDDPDEKGQLLLLSPILDEPARERARMANAKRLDAINQGR